MTRKLSSHAEGAEQVYLPPALYARKIFPSGTTCFVAGASDADGLLQLAGCLQGPFRLLYVLHTPRGEAEPGRYESPAISGDELDRFLRKFAEYLAADARFDIWIHSPESRATLVWDRHDQIFAYGPLAKYEKVLVALGYSEGECEISFPHIHHYRSEHDAAARALLHAFSWRHSPLRPEDEQ